MWNNAFDFGLLEMKAIEQFIEEFVMNHQTGRPRAWFQFLFRL
jgi:hypothetical protein